MDKKDLGIMILAAGMGTRMKSDIPKVLHTINGRSMITCVLECAVAIAEEKNIVVIVGHQSERVKKEISKRFSVSFALQKKLLGTGDAVRAGIPYLPDTVENIIVLCGDTPLIKPATISSLVAHHKNYQNDLTVLTVSLADPAGYGRVILDAHGELLYIREEDDASPSEKKISLVNSGIYCITRQFLVFALDLIRPNNAQQEYYLTDIAGIAKANGARAGHVKANDPRELKGVNTLQELKKLEGLIPDMDL